MASTWPPSLPVLQVRVARPTTRLDDVVAFYGGIVGLPELHRTTADGWTIVLLGLPDAGHHLELVAHADGLEVAPSPEDLLVLYFASAEEMTPVVERVRQAGAPEVALDNPWWARNRAVAFADPDGRRLVLMPRTI